MDIAKIRADAKEAAIEKELSAPVKDIASEYYKLIHVYGFSSDDARFIVHFSREPK